MTHNHEHNSFKNIFHKLQLLTKKSYAPYSQFLVAAIIQNQNQKNSLGVNIENVSYGVTVCAEVVAIGNWIVQKKTIINSPEWITILYLYSPQKDFIMPCGRCRQILIEHQQEKHPLKIYTFNQQGIAKMFWLNDLLPAIFTMKK